MKFKDVVHLYLNSGIKVKCDFYTNGGVHETGIKKLTRSSLRYFFHSVKSKPFLRRLSDMTLKERSEIFGEIDYWPSLKDGCFSIQQVISMINKGFDVFSLIENDEAIPSKEQKN